MTKNFRTVMRLQKKFLTRLLAMNFLLAGCSEEVQTPKSPLVKVQKVTLTNAAQEENYSDVVKGRYETNLSFQVGGKIISREVQTGSVVRAGEILMMLDPKDIVQQSRSAQAQVASAQAQLQLAKSNLDRYSELFKSEAIAAAVLDQYQTQFNAAQVWLVDGGKVSLHKVEVIGFADNSVRVNGLNSGDTVVVAGVHKLCDGQEVRTN